MRAVRFNFGGVPDYDGRTDGTTWNGFLNVRITPEVREQIARDCDGDPGEPESAAEFRALPVGADGFVDLSNGFATQEAERCECGGSGVHPYGVGGGWAFACDECRAAHEGRAREEEARQARGEAPGPEADSLMLPDQWDAAGRACFGDDWREVVAARRGGVRP